MFCNYQLVIVGVVLLCIGYLVIYGSSSTSIKEGFTDQSLKGTYPESKPTGGVWYIRGGGFTNPHNNIHYKTDGFIFGGGVIPDNYDSVPLGTGGTPDDSTGKAHATIMVGPGYTKPNYAMISITPPEPFVQYATWCGLYSHANVPLSTLASPKATTQLPTSGWTEMAWQSSPSGYGPCSVPGAGGFIMDPTPPTLEVGKTCSTFDCKVSGRTTNTDMSTTYCNENTCTAEQCCSPPPTCSTFLGSNNCPSGTSSKSANAACSAPDLGGSGTWGWPGPDQPADLPGTCYTPKDGDVVNIAWIASSYDMEGGLNFQGDDVYVDKEGYGIHVNYADLAKWKLTSNGSGGFYIQSGGYGVGYDYNKEAGVSSGKLFRTDARVRPTARGVGAGWRFVPMPLHGEFNMNAKDAYYIEPFKYNDRILGDDGHGNAVLLDKTGGNDGGSWNRNMSRWRIVPASGPIECGSGGKDPWKCSNAPSGSTNPGTCWGDSAYQCDAADRQGAYSQIQSLPTAGTSGAGGTPYSDGGQQAYELYMKLCNISPCNNNTCCTPNPQCSSLKGCPDKTTLTSPSKICAGPVCSTDECCPPNPVCASSICNAQTQVFTGSDC